MIKNSRIIFVLCALCFVLTTVYAKEVTIFYTGETRSMLYPCNCPKEPDGGVARRASLIKQLRKENPDMLLLDAGSFFAGGVMDEYKQNPDLDKERTLVNLKSMELMQYDAVAVGGEELNFGKDFLSENLKKTKLNFLSCNLKAENIIPYVIKEIAGIKVGIIGVTSLSAMKDATGLTFIEPNIALRKAVDELKKGGAKIIVLVSQLGESEDLVLIGQIPGIDVLIVGSNRIKEETFVKAANTLILRPALQGRRLGKVVVSFKDGEIADTKVEELRLSDKISDDPAVIKILPKCFSGADCKKEGTIGDCKDPGTLSAQCQFTPYAKIALSIIIPESCRACSTERFDSYLKKKFPGLEISYLKHPSAKAERLVKDLLITTLPAYIFGKEIDKEKVFAELKEKLELRGGYYIFKTEHVGVSYFVGREKFKGRVDLFISPYDKFSSELLDIVKEYKPVVHFLAVEQGGSFDTRRGNIEAEEYSREVCVQKYYPESFWDYLSCRTKNINSSWWEDCLVNNMDAGKIKSCAKGEEGRALLKDNISLNKALMIMFGPVFLLDNQEVFVSQGVPDKAAIDNIINKK